MEGGILGKLWTLCTCYRKVISYANLCLSLTQTSLFQLLPHNKLISACLVEGTRALRRDRKVLHFINLILNALTVHTYIRRLLSLILFPPRFCRYMKERARFFIHLSFIQSVFLRVVLGSKVTTALTAIPVSLKRGQITFCPNRALSIVFYFPFLHTHSFFCRWKKNPIFHLFLYSRFASISNTWIAIKLILFTLFPVFFFPPQAES